jgi:hypothetical protein
MYNEATQMYFSAKDAGYYDISSTGSSVSSLRFFTGGNQTTIRGYVYANTSNDIGFLHNGGDWAVRCNSSGVTLYGDSGSTGSFTATKFRFGSNNTLSGNGLPEIVDLSGVGMSMQSSTYRWYNSNASTILMSLDPSGNLTVPGNVTAYGPIIAVGDNSSSYIVFVNESSANKTWDISMFGNDWYLSESNVNVRLKVLANGGVYADAFYEFSDKRFKTLVKENPTIAGIESITAKSYIKEGKEELGYFAQDLEGVLDSAILKDKDDVLSLSYRQVHTAKIAALEKRIAELEAKLK